MHQLVTANDVKKYFRKAVLSVHPDKVRIYPKNHITYILTSKSVISFKSVFIHHLFLTFSFLDLPSH